MSDMPSRSAFLVDADGMIRGSWSYEATEVPDFDELLERRRALAWRPGGVAGSPHAASTARRPSSRRRPRRAAYAPPSSPRAPRATARPRPEITCSPSTASGWSGTSWGGARPRGETRTASSRSPSRRRSWHGWPFGIPFWPLDARSGRSSPGTSSCSRESCLPDSRRTDGCAPSRSPAAAAWPRRARFRNRPVQAGAERRPHPRVDRAVHPRCAVGVRALTRSSDRRPRARLGRSARSRSWPHPALRASSPRARRDSVRPRVRRRALSGDPVRVGAVGVGVR